MNIFTADNNKVLIEKVVEDVIKRANKNLGENFILIVPEKFSVTIEKELLLKSPRKALVNIQVVTLSRLLHKLLSKEHNFIPKETGVMLVKKIILDNYDQLVCYKKTAKTMGFSESIYDTIGELKNSKVTPKEYLSRSIGTLTSSLNLKLKDIFLIYNEYEKALTARALVDAADRFELLSGLVYKSEYIKNSHIYTLGFESTSFSGQLVFEAVASVAKSITFSCLDNQNKNNSYIARPEMKDAYEDIARNLGVKPNIFYFTNNRGKIQSHIANNMFAFPYYKMKIDGEIRLLSSKTINAEIEMVAERIRHRVVKDNLRYSDICVVCPNIDSYKSVISQVFSRYQIPYFLDNAEKLVDHPVVNFIMGVINTARKNFSVDEYLEVAHSEFSGLTIDGVSKLENFIIKYGINYDKLKEPFSFNPRKEEDKALLNEAEQQRNLLSGKILTIANLLNKASSVASFIDATKQIIEVFNLTDALSRFADALTKNKDFKDADATKQVLEKVTKILDSMQDIFGTTKLDLDEFYSIFQSGLQGETISLIPVSVDNVFVGDISTSKFFNVKDLYIIGASDGSVPKVKDDCGIIVDKELNMLSCGLGKKIEPTIRTINQREKFKVINILQEFSENLVVSYSKIGFSGEEQSPSTIIRELSKIFYTRDPKTGLDIVDNDVLKKFRGLLTEEDKIISYATEFATPNVSLTKVLKVLRDLTSGGRKLDVVESKAFYSLLEVLAKINNKSVQEYLNMVFEPKGKEELKRAKELFFTNGKMGITELECYFSCPFKHFASYGLKVKPRESADLGSIDYGNVLHKIAELYMKNIDKFEKSTNKSIIEKRKEIEKLIAYVFNEEKLKTATNKHMVMLLAEEAKRLIDALTYQYRQSYFRPVAAELKFGEGGEVPAVKNDSGINIEGKIDRVDVAGGYYRVIDYKTGHIDLTPKMTYYGLKLQLFNYLNALKNYKGLKPAGAFYLPIKNVFVEDKITAVDYSTYKLMGVYNSNEDVIKLMDKNLSPENSKSNVANITLSSSKINKETGALVPTGTGYIDEGTLDAVLNYQMEISSLATKEILDGYITPSPMEDGGRVPCDYCEYRLICGRDFDTSLGVRKSLSSIKYENFAVKKDKKDGK